jgi:polar amino acid transport system substrate-binding protein
MRKASAVLSGFAALAVMLAGCGSDERDLSGSSDEPAPEGGVCDTTDASGDLLAQVCEEGTLTVSTDPAYPPQSSLNEQTGELEGFDIDVATEIANRLGVSIDWQQPSWDVLTAGSWSGRWDMSVGSMTPTNDRQQVLDFTEPYYYTPAVVVVHEDNDSIQDVTTDLDGADIGFCAACTYEQYVDQSLDIKGYTFDFVIDDAVPHGYDTDTTALQDLALGDGVRLDAVMTSLTTAQGFINNDQPVKIVGDPVFYEPLAVAFDKNSRLDSTSLLEEVDTIVGEMHDDGTLTEMSEKWYDGTDLTVKQ